MIVSYSTPIGSGTGIAQQSGATVTSTGHCAEPYQRARLLVTVKALAS
jgi:hypothetical protein